MKTFEYIIKDELGIHARPAGMLVKKAQSLGSTVTIEVNGKTADATKVFAVMGLGAKQNDVIKITVDGGDEDASVRELTEFFTANL